MVRYSQKYPKIACYDVFDTVLLRAVAAPSDAFRLIFRRIIAQSGARLRDWDENSFVSARIQAERAALQECGFEECNLDEIWRELSKLIPEVPSDAGQMLELEVEKSIIRVNREIAHTIDDSRKGGSRIAFLSDTPLPRSFIYEELQQHGVLKPNDELLVSSELRETKRSGSLYRRLMRDSGTPSKAISMTGDNFRADVQIPTMLGFSANHYAAARLGNRYERSLSSLHEINHLARSVVFSASRNTRLSLLHVNGHVDLATRLGKACFAWALWALLRATELRLKRLYFVSRDAFLAWRCAALIQKNFGVECRYLSISRQAILPAASEDVSPSELSWLIRPWDTPTYGLICRRLDIEPERCGRQLSSLILSKGLDLPLSATDLCRFWEALGEDVSRSYVVSQFRAKRESAIGYLRQEGMLDGDDWALVDLGWHLSVQSAVNHLVSPNSVARGLYVYLSDDRPPPTKAGKVYTMFPVVPDDAAAVGFRPTVFRFATVSEHVLGLASHGQVTGYEWAGHQWRPICQNEDAELRKRRIEIIRDVEQFAAGHAALFADVFASPAECAALFEATTRSLLLDPSDGLARELANAVLVSGDHNNADQRPLARPLRTREALGIIWRNESASDGAFDQAWRPGCISLSRGVIRSVLRAWWHLPGPLRAALHRISA